MPVKRARCTIREIVMMMLVKKIPSKMEVAPRCKLLSDTVHAVDTVDTVAGLRGAGAQGG